jgi:hypothetical protein
MNDLKKSILQITAGLLLGDLPRPHDGNLSNVKSLGQCVAFILEQREGGFPANVSGCRLKGEEPDIFNEVVWDLICARVVTPEIDGPNRLRVHSDARANWEKLEAATDDSNQRPSAS